MSEQELPDWSWPEDWHRRFLAGRRRGRGQGLGHHAAWLSADIIAESASKPEKRKVSMLQDVLAQRPTEVDFVNGAIAARGDRLGVPVPLNRALWQLIKRIGYSWADPS
jgi:hypothetical protein